MKKTSLLVLAASVIALTISTTGCTRKSADSGNEILVGEYGSLSGSEATFGISTSEGVNLAFAEKNKAGGIKGKQIKLITLDNQGKPEEARAAVQRLVTQDRVVAVIGEVASGRTLAAAPVAQQYKVPMITPSSTNPKVTEVGDYIFRVCFIDPFQGLVMAKFAHQEIKKQRVAILRDVKSDYSGCGAGRQPDDPCAADGSGQGGDHPARNHPRRGLRPHRFVLSG